MKKIPQLELVAGMPPIIYCGCREEAGHYLFVPPMMRLDHELKSPSLLKLDTAFAPQDTFAEGAAWYHSGRSAAQGVALQPPPQLDPGIRYNVISFWDNSVDSRPGSHSTFLTLGDRCFNDALAECRAAFPEVFARFKFEVKLRRNMFL